MFLVSEILKFLLSFRIEKLCLFLTFNKMILVFKTNLRKLWVYSLKLYIFKF